MSKEEKLAEKEAAKESLEQRRIEKEMAKHLSAAEKAHNKLSIISDTLFGFLSSDSSKVDRKQVGQWANDVYEKLEATIKQADATIASGGRTAFPKGAKEIDAINKDAIGLSKMMERLCQP